MSAASESMLEMTSTFQRGQRCPNFVPSIYDNESPSLFIFHLRMDLRVGEPYTPDPRAALQFAMLPELATFARQQ